MSDDLRAAGALFTQVAAAMFSVTAVAILPVAIRGGVYPLSTTGTVFLSVAAGVLALVALAWTVVIRAAE